MNTTTEPLIFNPNGFNPADAEKIPLTDEILELRTFLMTTLVDVEVPVAANLYRFCDWWILTQDHGIASDPNAVTNIKKAYATFK
tara:strand:- start:826 stop:1080 length:255 start_codon:yes stop_codon:yes gene_type:complete